MSSVVLLEPYRSAITADGIETGIIQIPKGINYLENPALRIGSNKELQQKVRELCLFYDEIMVINHETESTVKELEEKGLQSISFLQMRSSGMLSFPNLTIDKERIKNLGKMNKISDWWMLEKELIDTWKPLISSQIVARGKLPHQSLFEVLYYDRIGDSAGFKTALENVPNKWKGFIPDILFGYQPLGFDFIVLSTLDELLGVEEVVSRSGANVAVDNIFGGMPSSISVDNSNQIVRIIIESLLKEELRFPTPYDLFSMKKIQGSAEMVSFRSVFNPWLKSLSIGNEEEIRLRAEVKKSIRQFRNQPRLSLAKDLSTLISIPAALYGLGGAIVSAALNLSSFGIEKLAELWKSKSSWVGICPEGQSKSNE